MRIDPATFEVVNDLSVSEAAAIEGIAIQLYRSWDQPCDWSRASRPTRDDYRKQAKEVVGEYFR